MPRGRSAPGGIYNPVAWKVAVVFGTAQYGSDKSGVVFSPDKPCNLTIRSNAPLRNFFNDGENLVYKLFRKNTVHKKSLRKRFIHYST